MSIHIARPEPPDGYMKEKVLINGIGEPMFEFLEGLQLDVDYTNSELKDKCQESNHRLKSVTAIKITRSMKKYAEFKDYVLEEGHGQKRTKMLTKTT